LFYELLKPLFMGTLKQQQRGLFVLTVPGTKADCGVFCGVRWPGKFRVPGSKFRVPGSKLRKVAGCNSSLVNVL
jgi:hypothetical protein